MKSILYIIGLFLIATSVNGQGLGQGTIEAPVNYWPVANPDTLDLNKEALQSHLERCRRSGASGCLVAYKGYIVQQWYRPKDYLPWIGTRSAVKSWTGLLTGILIKDGSIESIDDPVAKYIPEWTAGAKAGVTIRHLLTMTAGLRDHTGGEITVPRVDQPHDNKNRHPGVVGQKNHNAYVLDLELDWPPGKHFSYSNEGVQLLSPILKRAAGMPVSQYARERLFNPLKMDSTIMLVDEYHNTVTFGGTRTTLRDFAKIGQLMLNKGNWNGHQIVSTSWVEQSTTSSPIMKNYGFLWWLDPERSNYAAAGSGDNNCIVFPDIELVVARLQRDRFNKATVKYQSTETLELIRSIVVENTAQAK
ncbi:serine hydrolase domain-containing protein [Fodinibius salsisoli]|uniref:Serine hydrolase n=1 Tax=Fodinibius salsisoli TaxID=2820877 RepID=A0ABT3PSI8_9BACT|nr:serine hydrolase [Fodinibius salsisoli]MCW9708824.1 serine hydrolase [Fodinibius salsisoli]